ncbi:MAG: SUMF1/EgtB/PvdO family nonheme iron enzyme, partial [Anaerolineae bacterium]|nr:SUMF1/EgtB/PvdO family nonheme iron enzyme [Anaerolineae bacterium]
SPFWIDVYEVTNALYEACVDAGVCLSADACASDACNTPAFSREFFDEPDQPVIAVNWFMANAYCQWREARLPTEAEWEYAARGPDGLEYPWGNEWNGDNLVFWLNTNRQTANVSSRPGGVSWIGAYDLSGNVSEWVADWYDIYSSEHQTNPTGPQQGTDRVLRGGSYFEVNVATRGTYRHPASPNLGFITIGFRCARSLAD